jgi:hypothetical protein
LKVLFNVDTYKGARVRRPDTHTYVIENVKGHPLRIKFERRMKDWGAGIDVTVARTDSFPPQEVTFYRSDSEATAEMKQFWTMLNDLAFQSNETYSDELRKFAQDVLTGKVPEPKKRK